MKEVKKKEKNMVMVEVKKLTATGLKKRYLNSLKECREYQTTIMEDRTVSKKRRS